MGIRQVACLFEQDENSIAIRLEGAVNIADAPELKGMLDEAFGSDQELRLDLKEATYLDICILQLICCADRQWRLAHKSLVLLGPLTDAVSAGAATAGLHELLASINAGVVCEV